MQKRLLFASLQILYIRNIPIGNRKLLRIICLAIYYGFARFLPHSNAPYAFGAKRLRYTLAKKLFKKIGKNVNIERLAFFRSGGNIEIDDNSGLGINCNISHAKIGKNVMMGSDFLYIARNHAFDRRDIPMMEQSFTPTKEIVIGDDVWIGARVIILPGISVGKGAIIGAGSVVTKNVPEFSVVAGNPAKIIRYRD